MSDLSEIRERWRGVEWIYGEEQEGEYIASAYIIEGGSRILDLEEPDATERDLLSRATAAPGDVQALLAELERLRQRHAAAMHATATLVEQLHFCEADGVAACLALQEACTWIGLGKRPDEATIERWRATLAPFAGNALLLERAAAHRLADAAAAWFVAGSAAKADPSEQRQTALTYASDQLSAALMAYHRASALTPPPATPQPASAELELVKADAALLLRQIQIWRRAIDDGHLRTATDSLSVLAQLAQRDHPGAALLTELEAARAVVAAARHVLSESLNPSALSSVLVAYDEAVKGAAG